LFFTPGTVWPGDANHDGSANNTDLLAVGLAYGNTGPIRAGASIVWQGQAATDWTDTLANGANQKHVDCNGDGVANANDTVAILQNYGLTHAKTDDLADPWRAGSPELSIQYSKDTVVAGDTLTVSFLLGDAVTPVSNIYGLAFTYHYNPLVVDSNSIVFRYPNSWFGTGSNKISIHKDFKKPGLIRTAITGIDHINRSGNGKIAEFIATITTGNINGKNLSYFNNLTYITEITAVDKNGKSIQINAGRDSNEVAYTPTGINDLNKAMAVAVYPNPTQSSITVKVNREAVGTSYTLSDVMGRVIRSGQLMQETNLLPLVEFEKGVYILQIGDALKQSIKVVKE
jgi:hypothetical protein